MSSTKTTVMSTYQIILLFCLSYCCWMGREDWLKLQTRIKQFYFLADQLLVFIQEADSSDPGQASMASIMLEMLWDKNFCEKTDKRFRQVQLLLDNKFIGQTQIV